MLDSFPLPVRTSIPLDMTGEVPLVEDTGVDVLDDESRDPSILEADDM